MNDREQHIRKQAYHLWENDGRPHGRDQDYWYRAAHEYGEETKDEAVGLSDDRGESFGPVNVAAAPAAPTTSSLLDGPPAAEADVPAEPDRLLPPGAYPADVDPNVRMEGGEVEPVSEIASIRRTLEVPRDRRGESSPLADVQGALSGGAGRRRPAR